MRASVRRLLVIIAAGALVAGLDGCASGPAGASHTPPVATATPAPTPPPTPPVTTPQPTMAPATPPETPPATPPPASEPTPATSPMPGTTPAASFPWPSGAPTVGPGQVEFGLLVTGTPAPGEELDLYFQAPHVGQNEFQLCGAISPCRPESGQVYTWGSRNLPSGASPWAFQKRLGGTTTTIESGTLDAAQGAVITGTVSS